MNAMLVTEEVEVMDYLAYKTEILNQLGLNDTDAVKEYLKNASG